LILSKESNEHETETPRRRLARFSGFLRPCIRTNTTGRDIMKCYLIVFAILAGATISLAYGVRAQAPPGANVPQAATAVANGVDREAITKTARDFAEAFNQGDAKAIAAMWTENGESREASGRTFLGRAAIEKAYAEFFKANKGTKIEVLVKSVRF